MARSHARKIKSSHRQSRKVASFPRSRPIRRLDENLRVISTLAAQPDLVRRQFEPSIQEFPDEFRAKSDEKFPVSDQGIPVQLTRTASPPLVNVNKNNVRKSQLPALHYYVSERSDNVLLCSRRRVRRSVLFALRRTRKGSAKGKSHLWTEKSKIRCV